MRLRNYFIIGAFCAIMLIAWSVAVKSPCVRAYTYESEINPGPVVAEWEVIGGSKLDDDGWYFLVMKNPDPTHDIQFVLCKIYFPSGRMLFQYSYYKDSKLLVYKAKSGGLYAPAVPSAVDLEDARQWLDPAQRYYDFDREEKT